LIFSQQHHNFSGIITQTAVSPQQQKYLSGIITQTTVSPEQ